MDNIVFFNYTNPLHPTAFGSIKKVAKFYRPDVSLARVKAILLQNKVYTTKRREKKIKHYVPIYAYYRRELLQLDLIETRILSKSNSGVNYLLMIYDSASKYSWVIALKNKSMLLVSQKLDEFFTSLDQPVRRCLTDSGAEFRGSLSQKVFQKHGIKLSHPTPGKHCR